MKLSKGFRTWFARRAALIIFTVIVMFLVALKIWSDQKPEPVRFTRTFASSTQNVEVSWLNQNFYPKMTTEDGGVIYAMPFSNTSLVAIDDKKGTILWLGRGGEARGLLANQNTVFVITSVEIDAYKATTGELKWATNLGYGRVSIFSQIDSGVVRIYYGDKIIEIDPETGKILTSKPREDIIWVSGNIALRANSVKQYSVSGKQLSAFDKRTGEILWNKTQSFYIDEVQTPQSISENTLMIGREPAGTSNHVSGICALDLQSGEYNWCRPETYYSNMAIDYQSKLGYAMREDLVLLTIDLQTGNVLGETRFLSSKPIDEQIGFMSSIVFSNGVVVISFSDSGQTFGLSFRQ